MRESRHFRLSRPVVLSSLLFAALAAQACGGDENKATSGTGGTGGMGGAGGAGGGQSAGVSPAANGTEFSRPFDATPDPKGDEVYFSALDPNGEPAIFKSKLDGTGTASPLFAGAPLVTPLNLATSTDGTKIFVTDTGADTGAADGDAGRIFVIANDGGTPSPLTAADRYRPRGIEVVSEDGADVIYFAGTEPGGEAGVFKMAADGSGAVAVVAKGAPFVDPSGVVVSASGDVYACDTTQDDGHGSVIAVEGGAATTLATGIRAGYPCGITTTADGSTVLVSALDAEKGTSTVVVVDIATKGVSLFSNGIDMNTESGGLHRAKAIGNVFAWAGATAGAGSSGTVYRVQLP